MVPFSSRESLYRLPIIHLYESAARTCRVLLTNFYKLSTRYVHKSLSVEMPIDDSRSQAFTFFLLYIFTSGAHITCVSERAISAQSSGWLPSSHTVPRNSWAIAAEPHKWQAKRKITAPWQLSREKPKTLTHTHTCWILYPNVELGESRDCPATLTVDCCFQCQFFFLLYYMSLLCVDFFAFSENVFSLEHSRLFLITRVYFREFLSVRHKIANLNANRLREKRDVVF